MVAVLETFVEAIAKFVVYSNFRKKRFLTIQEKESICEVI